jgi:PAS domain S-box-containing protein
MENHSTNTSLALENARLRKRLNDSEIQRERERFLLQKLDLFSENTPMAVINWDLNSGITDWNKSAETIFGYTKKEALGKMAADFMLPESTKKLTNKVWKSLYEKTGGTRSTNENIRKDGKIITCEWYNTPLINEKGDVVGISSMALDITEKINTEKVIDESNARFKMLSELTFEGIIIHSDGIAIDINSSLERLTQYSREEIIGNNIIELLMVEKYIPLILENINKDEAAPYEVEGKRKDGKIIWVEIEAKNFHYNGQNLRAVAIRDIQERKKNEQKLHKALYKAQESERLKSTFLSTISHELRTPLNAVIGFSDLIDESMDITEAANLSEMIFKSGNHLLEILNDIFELSMLEEGTMILSKQNYDLHNMLDEVKEHILLDRRKMNKNHILFNCNFNSEKFQQINTDQKHFKQVLIHLLKNAFKYTSEGSVELGYNLIPNAYEFYIKDTGIGIEKKKQEHIFDHFRQLDDRHTREFEGVGIGLSIAKTLCENLGGEIRVDSELGKGSTFYFTLPREDDANEITPKEPEKSNDLSILYGKTIMIAEDDAGSFELLEMYLKPWKVKILWAKNGVEAIDIFSKNNSIDIILMDIKMPILSGYEATKEIKLVKPSVPIIAQTAYAINNEKEIALAAGCDDYISKPISWTVLSEKMFVHLQKAGENPNNLSSV